MHIVVVGAGLAGSFFAYYLADSEHTVTLLDHTMPREKPCGGGIPARVFAKFPDLANLSCAYHSPHIFRYISSDGKETTIPISGQFFVVSRRDFDAAILQQVIQKGHNIRLIQERVTAVEFRSPHWYVRTPQREIVADVLIGADGASSLVRKQILGATPPEHYAFTVGYFITNVPLDTLIIRTYNDLEGYLWYFPRSDHASVGIGCRRGRGLPKESWARLNNFLAQYYPSAEKYQRWGAIVPSFSDPHLLRLPCAGPNWALLGDAAGHANPITGEGIYYALTSAYLAAQAILVSQSIQDYDRLWRVEYGYGPTLTSVGSFVSKLHNIEKAFAYKGYEMALKRAFLLDFEGR